MTLSEIRVVQQEFRDLVHEALSYGPNPILSRRYLEIRFLTLDLVYETR